MGFQRPVPQLDALKRPSQGERRVAPAESREEFALFGCRKVMKNYPKSMPKHSMYGLFTFIWLIFILNVGN